jgi:hypothetical protein
MDFYFENKSKPGMMIHACNLRTQEAEVGGSWVWGQLGYIVRPWLKKRKAKLLVLYISNLQIIYSNYLSRYNFIFREKLQEYCKELLYVVCIIININ